MGAISSGSELLYPIEPPLVEGPGQESLAVPMLTETL
jgi:hypothetical protein